MRYIHFYIIIMFITLIACKESGPQPSDLIGVYDVKARLADDAIDKTKVKEEIKSALEKAGHEMKKAREDLEKEFDMSSGDTTTMEGKMEYAAKNFGKSMAEAELDMGNLSKEFGEAMSDLASGSLNFSESILRSFKIEVELQADGDIKSKNGIFNLGFSNARWEVKGNDFIISNHNNESPEIMQMINRDYSGFSLQKDKLIIEFTKKK